MLLSGLCHNICQVGVLQGLLCRHAVHWVGPQEAHDEVSCQRVLRDSAQRLQDRVGGGGVVSLQQ